MHYICYCTVGRHAYFIMFCLNVVQMVVIIVCVFLYGRLYLALALSGLEFAIMKQARFPLRRFAARSFDGLANVYGGWTRKRFQKRPGGFHNHAASALFSVLHFLPWDQVTLFWPHNSPWWCKI